MCWDALVLEWIGWEWIRRNKTALGWTGSDLAGLKLTGLDRTGLNYSGLDWIEYNCIGPEQTALLNHEAHNSKTAQ